MLSCRKLLALNPDNYRYHDGLREALQLQPDASGAWTDQQRRSLAALYDGLAKDHPQSSAAKRIPLDFKAGPPLRAQGVMGSATMLCPALSRLSML